MLFDSKNVLIPDYENSIYNLSSSIANVLGIKKGKELKNLDLGEKLIFILMDGMGENILNKTSLNLEHETITSVFPSTTCTAMTTLITADLPSKHGIIGFLGYDKISGNLINLLDFESGTIYETQKIKESLKRIFSNVKSMAFKTEKKFTMVLPFFSANAPIVKVLTEGAELRWYLNIWDGIAQVISLARENADFIFLYVPYVDLVSHYYGPSSETTIITGRELLQNLIKYLKKLVSGYDIILTADHGQIDVDKVKMLNRNLLEISKLPVLGDVRMHLFYLDGKAEFFNNSYKIFSFSDVSFLFGGEDNINNKLSVGIALDRNIYLTEITKGENYLYKGHHSSLLKDEMLVPLIRFTSDLDY